MEEDRRRWEARHEQAGPAGPAAPVALDGRPDLVAALPRTGRALDVAAGTGAVTSWLAQRGLRVTAVDISRTAVDLALRSAREAGVDQRVDARPLDLDDGLPADLRDLDVVVCQRFRDVRLYPAIVEVLAPGGVGIVTVLSMAGRPGPPGTFHARPGELVEAFDRDDTEVLHHREGDGLASVVFRRR